MALRALWTVILPRHKMAPVTKLALLPRALAGIIAGIYR
jgi:hypothetical protein